MNFGEITETAIAEVVSLTMTEQLVNVNEEFVQRMVNKAYHIIERRALWKFSEGEAEIHAVANTRVCADTPADFSIPIAVWSESLSEELAYHDERQKFHNPNSTGTVQAYGMWEGDLRFYPLPNSSETFTLRYYKAWSDLSDPSDVPVFPSTWHDLLVEYAAGKLALRLPPTGDRFLPYSKAQPYLDSFKVGVEEMANSDLVLPTWDAVPNYGFQDEVLALGEW